MTDYRRPKTSYVITYEVGRRTAIGIEWTERRFTKFDPYGKYDGNPKKFTADAYSAACRYAKPKIGDVIKVTNVVRKDTASTDVTDMIVAGQATYKGEHFTCNPNDVEDQIRDAIANKRENMKRILNELNCGLRSNLEAQRIHDEILIDMDTKEVDIEDPNRRSYHGPNQLIEGQANGYVFRGPGLLRALHVNFPDPKLFGTDREFYKTLRGWYEGRTYEVYLDKNGVPCQGRFLGEFKHSGKQTPTELARDAVIAHNESRIVWKEQAAIIRGGRKDTEAARDERDEVQRQLWNAKEEINRLNSCVQAATVEYENLRKRRHEDVQEINRLQDCLQCANEATKEAQRAKHWTDQPFNVVKAKQERDQAVNQIETVRRQRDRLQSECVELRRLMCEAEEQLQKRNDL